jgi:uncharacterized membrane protein (UPF0127 family)
LLLLILFLGAACGRQASIAPMETLALTIRGHTLQVEVAVDPAQRERGLMFRRDLPEHGGMLFVFPEDAPLAFWIWNRSKRPL